MSEAAIAALVVFACALPALLLGVACVVGAWMPARFASAVDPRGLQRIFGQGLLQVGATLLLFALLVLLLPPATLRWLAPLFAAGITAITLIAVLRMTRLRR